MSRWLLLHNVARLALATSTVVAMSYLLATIRDRPDFNVGNYFSWLVEPLRHRLPLRVALAWLAYPIAWLAKTLVRGAAES